MLKNQKAFTLIELLVTLSVFGILASLALPSFQKQVANNKSLALADEYTGALNYARSEALKRGKSITLCPANTAGTACGADWKDGWLVVIDTAAKETTKPPVVANDDAILRRWEANKAIVELSDSRQFIRYTGLGALARVEGTAKALITLSIDKCSGKSKRTITIALSGMLTTETLPCP